MFPVSRPRSQGIRRPQLPLWAQYMMVTALAIAILAPAFYAVANSTAMPVAPAYAAAATPAQREQQARIIGDMSQLRCVMPTVSESGEACGRPAGETTEECYSLLVEFTSRSGARPKAHLPACAECAQRLGLADGGLNPTVVEQAARNFQEEKNSEGQLAHHSFSNKEFSRLIAASAPK